MLSYSEDLGLTKAADLDGADCQSGPTFLLGEFYCADGSNLSGCRDCSPEGTRLVTYERGLLASTFAHCSYADMALEMDTAILVMSDLAPTYNGASKTLKGV